MPTRRKFRRNKRKSRRRGKKGGLGNEYKYADEITSLKFPADNIEENIKNLAQHYYIAKYTFDGAMQAKYAPLDHDKKQIMENSLGLCYLLALQQIKDLVKMNEWGGENTELPDNDPKQLYFKGIELEQESVKKQIAGKTFNGMDNNFTMPFVGKGFACIKCGKQFGTMMTAYGGTLGGPWRNPINSNTIINHANWKGDVVPFNTAYNKDRINLKHIK